VALLGSLRLNWPSHPPVLVYDLGLDEATRGLLAEHAVQVREVPAFCPHWRQHFTWKLWCLADAPAREVVWMDAGLVVLEPLDEVFDAIAGQGYFFTTNYELLDWEASDEACAGCGVPPEVRRGRPTLAATLMGFRKAGPTLALLSEALEVGLVERNIAATAVTHRHDQALLSLLAYKHLGRVLLADGQIYLGSLSPDQVPGQKVWVHRRSMRREDGMHFAVHLSRPGERYRPRPPYPLAHARARADIYRVYWYYGRGERDEAGRRLAAAFAADPALRAELALLAEVLRRHAGRLQGFSTDPEEGSRYLAWVGGAFASLHGGAAARDLESALAGT
jgi:hypothetical protein